MITTKTNRKWGNPVLRIDRKFTKLRIAVSAAVVITTVGVGVASTVVPALAAGLTLLPTSAVNQQAGQITGSFQPGAPIPVGVSFQNNTSAGVTVFPANVGDTVRVGFSRVVTAAGTIVTPDGAAKFSAGYLATFCGNMTNTGNPATDVPLTGADVGGLAGIQAHCAPFTSVESTGAGDLAVTMTLSGLPAFIPAKIAAAAIAAKAAIPVSAAILAGSITPGKLAVPCAPVADIPATLFTPFIAACSNTPAVAAVAPVPAVSTPAVLVAVPAVVGVAAVVAAPAAPGTRCTANPVEPTVIPCLMIVAALDQSVALALPVVDVSAAQVVGRSTLASTGVCNPSSAPPTGCAASRVGALTLAGPSYPIVVAGAGYQPGLPVTVEAVCTAASSSTCIPASVLQFPGQPGMTAAAPSGTFQGAVQVLNPQTLGSPATAGIAIIPAVLAVPQVGTAAIAGVAASANFQAAVPATAAVGVPGDPFFVPGTLAIPQVGTAAILAVPASVAFVAGVAQFGTPAVNQVGTAAVAQSFDFAAAIPTIPQVGFALVPASVAFVAAVPAGPGGVPAAIPQQGTPAIGTPGTPGFIPASVAFAPAVPATAFAPFIPQQGTPLIPASLDFVAAVPGTPQIGTAAIPASANFVAAVPASANFAAAIPQQGTPGSVAFVAAQPAIAQRGTAAIPASANFVAAIPAVPQVGTAAIPASANFVAASVPFVAGTKTTPQVGTPQIGTAAIPASANFVAGIPAVPQVGTAAVPAVFAVPPTPAVPPGPLVTPGDRFLKVSNILGPLTAIPNGVGGIVPGTAGCTPGVVPGCILIPGVNLQQVHFAPIHIEAAAPAAPTFDVKAGAPGVASTLTGKDFEPRSIITLQRLDSAGHAFGAPETTRADGIGTFVKAYAGGALDFPVASVKVTSVDAAFGAATQTFTVKFDSTGAVNFCKDAAACNAGQLITESVLPGNVELWTQDAAVPVPSVDLSTIDITDSTTWYPVSAPGPITQVVIGDMRGANTGFVVTGQSSDLVGATQKSNIIPAVDVFAAGAACDVYASAGAGNDPLGVITSGADDDPSANPGASKLGDGSQEFCTVNPDATGRAAGMFQLDANIIIAGRPITAVDDYTGLLTLTITGN